MEQCIKDDWMGETLYHRVMFSDVMSAFCKNLILGRVSGQSADLSERTRKQPKIHIDIVKTGKSPAPEAQNQGRKEQIYIYILLLLLLLLSLLLICY
jgi:hypothetical protein